MLVYNPKEKSWKCVDPSDEEVDELLELGKQSVVHGFSAQFMADLIQAAMKDHDILPEEVRVKMN